MILARIARLTGGDCSTVSLREGVWALWPYKVILKGLRLRMLDCLHRKHAACELVHIALKTLLHAHHVRRDGEVGAEGLEIDNTNAVRNECPLPGTGVPPGGAA